MMSMNSVDYCQSLQCWSALTCEIEAPVTLSPNEECEPTLDSLFLAITRYVTLCKLARAQDIAALATFCLSG
jgi:hypothetical protein